MPTAPSSWSTRWRRCGRPARTWASGRRSSARWSSCSATRARRPRSCWRCGRLRRRGRAEHKELGRTDGRRHAAGRIADSAEIERAITRPAARAGLALEEGLAETIVDEAGNEPGLLPLLSVALTQLWEQRADERLTYAGYVAVGGIAGAIATLAEAVWSEPRGRRPAAARVLLLRLAGPGDGLGVVRRRVPWWRSRPCRCLGFVASWDAWPRPGCSRSGTLTSRSPTRRCSVSGHGCRAWLADDAAGRAVQRRLAVAASEWASEGREPGALWRGTRLLSGQEVPARDPRRSPTSSGPSSTPAGPGGRRGARRQRARAATARQNRRLRWLLARRPASSWRWRSSPVCSRCARVARLRSRPPRPKPRRCPPTLDGSPPTRSTRTSPPSPCSRRSRRRSASRARRRTARCSPC